MKTLFPLLLGDGETVKLFVVQDVLPRRYLESARSILKKRSNLGAQEEK